MKFYPTIGFWGLGYRLEIAGDFTRNEKEVMQISEFLTIELVPDFERLIF